MKNAKRSLLNAVLSGTLSMAALAVSALAQGSELERAGSPLTYDVRGEVLDVNAGAATVTVAHETIAGLMPAMIMPFSVQDQQELDGLRPGAAVEFEFVVGKEGSFARDFKILAEGVLRLPEALARKAPTAKPKRADVGDRAPGVNLLDESGVPTALADSDRYTVMTFIFTRCPVPEFCPLMSRNFQQLQAALGDRRDLKAAARLLSVTLDPEFDTPDILRQYGEAIGADFDSWTFATGSQAAIDEVAESFRVYRKRDGALLDHTLCTALIAPDGTVLEVWRGNRWQPLEVVERINDAVHGDGSSGT